MELCGSSKGGEETSGETKPWTVSDCDVVGLNPIEVLKEVVLVELGGNRALQRITNEFKSICDLL